MASCFLNAIINVTPMAAQPIGLVARKTNDAPAAFINPSDIAFKPTTKVFIKPTPIAAFKATIPVATVAAVNPAAAKAEAIPLIGVGNLDATVKILFKPLAKGCSTAIKADPIWFVTTSKLPPKIFVVSPKLAIASLVLSATSLLFLILLNIASIFSSVWPISAMNFVPWSVPNNAFIISICSPSSRPFNLSLNFLIVSSIGKSFPSASKTSAPSSFIAVVSIFEPFVIFKSSPFAPDAAICNLCKPVFKPVPASLPLIPALANNPNVATVSFKVNPKTFAVGAAIFNDSPRILIVCAELFAPAVKISTALSVLETSIPKTCIVVPTIRPISANSVDVASAPKTIPFKLPVISLELLPILANSVASSATCWGVPAAIWAVLFTASEIAVFCPVPSIAAAFVVSSSNLLAPPTIPLTARPNPTVPKTPANFWPVDNAWPSNPFNFFFNLSISPPNLLYALLPITVRSFKSVKALICSLNPFVVLPAALAIRFISIFILPSCTFDILELVSRPFNCFLKLSTLFAPSTLAFNLKVVSKFKAIIFYYLCLNVLKPLFP